MDKTITVKGTGTLSVKPNYIEIEIELVTKNMVYDDAYNNSLDKISKLNEAVVNSGFDKEDLKTTNFSINTEYDSVKNEENEYKRVFNGYKVLHDLRIGFDFDIAKLNKVISEITKTDNNPNFNIQFTVKDQSEVKEKLLKNAADNAKKTAEILCRASNVNLGELIRIDYNWGEINLYSRTNYSTGVIMESASMKSMKIEPDDIEVSDNATFIWEIK